MSVITGSSLLLSLVVALAYVSSLSVLSPVSIQTQRTQAPANRNGRSKQPIIEAANQTLALLAVFVYATHATQSVACVAFGWKPGFSLIPEA